MTLVRDVMPGIEPETPQRGNPRRWRVSRTFLLVVPALVFVILAFGFPVYRMFWLSFTDFPQDDASLFSNYIWYFSDATQMAILRRTFLVSVWVTISCLALGFPYAYLMTVVGPRARLLMLAGVMLPFWSNLVVRTYAWVILLQDKGPIPDLIRYFGIEPPRLVGNSIGMTIGATQVLLPFLVLPLYAGLQGIDRRLLDAARSLGATGTRAFVKVYLPLAVPGIMAGAMLVFVISLGFYFTPALLGSAGESLISQQIVVQTSKLLEFGRGGTLALTLLVLTLVFLALAALVSRGQLKRLGSGAE